MISIANSKIKVNMKCIFITDFCIFHKNKLFILYNITS